MDNFQSYRDKKGKNIGKVPSTTSLARNWNRISVFRRKNNYKHLSRILSGSEDTIMQLVIQISGRQIMNLFLSVTGLMSKNTLDPADD